MDRIFKEEGVIDEDSFSETEAELIEVENDKGINEIIGHMEDKDGEDLGELVVRNKTTNKIKLRPKNSFVSRKRKRYQCDICGRIFSHPSRLEVHKSFHKNENYMCAADDCNYQVETRLEIDNHHKETGHSGFSIIKLESNDISDEAGDDKNDGKKIICKICNKTFSCKQNHEVHFKAIHENQKPYKCEKCDKTFPYLSSFKCHLQQHTEKIYPCENCTKIFNHPSSLVYHREAEHNNGRRFVCSKCKKTFKHKQLLLRHQLVHSNVRPHDCKYCSASFKTRANLLNHMPTHTGERKYFCNVCSQTFAHKTSLTLHMRWHNGSKPYECDVCQKTFSQKGNLAEHKRIHTGEN
nr:zinc finger protein 271-like [Onthophagus taurus]